MTTIELREIFLRMNGFAKQVFDGNPIDMVVQGLVGVVGAVVGVWLRINPFVGIYVALVVIDTVLGVAQSRKKGVALSWSRLLWGPGEKILFAGLIIAAAEYIVTFTGPWLTKSVASYISSVLFLEAVGKYDYLSGRNVLGQIRETASSFINLKPRKKK